MTFANRMQVLEEKEFVKLLHKREASISIGASTARGMGKGTVEKATRLCENLNLAYSLRALRTYSYGNLTQAQIHSPKRFPANNGVPQEVSEYISAWITL